MSYVQVSQCIVPLFRCLSVYNIIFHVYSWRNCNDCFIIEKTYWDERFWVFFRFLDIFLTYHFWYLNDFFVEESWQCAHSQNVLQITSTRIVQYSPHDDAPRGWWNEQYEMTSMLQKISLLTILSKLSPNFCPWFYKSLYQMTTTVNVL